MIHQLHKLEFPICSFGMCHILEWSAEFLDGHVLLHDCVVRSAATHKEKALGSSASRPASKSTHASSTNDQKMERYLRPNPVGGTFSARRPLSDRQCQAGQNKNGSTKKTQPFVDGNTFALKRINIGKKTLLVLFRWIAMKNLLKNSETRSRFAQIWR
jgi:hypothetical protein